MADTDLIDIPSEKAFDVFTREGGVEPYIEIVRKAVDGFVPSVETEADRAEVRSTAFRIVRSRTYLEKVGKAVADEQKRLPKLIDAARRRCDAELRDIEERVRGPLTAWENAEKVRKERHVVEVDRLNDIGTDAMRGEPIEDMRCVLAEIQAMEISEAKCEEFYEEYVRAQNKARDTLTRQIAEREKHDADQAELARLRAAEDARKAEEAERLRQQHVKEQQEAAERQRAEDIRKAEAAAEQRARDEERAEAQRREDALRADAAKREAEIAQQKADEERERKAEERRAANKRHQAKVNSAAALELRAIIEQAVGLSQTHEVPGLDAEIVSRAIVTAIAKGTVPGVAMVY